MRTARLVFESSNTSERTLTPILEKEHGVNADPVDDLDDIEAYDGRRTSAWTRMSRMNLATCSIWTEFGVAAPLP